MEESKGKRQKVASAQRKDLIPELLQTNEGEYFENIEHIKEEPISDEEEIHSKGLIDYKQRFKNSLGNELNEQLETVKKKVVILLSQKENLLKQSKEDNLGLKDENFRLHSELK